ncbi:MAG: hypothetical protein KAQ94_07225 [Arcobacteraceae bacterium]|nr:hypothetical protein [Arcobacteraceae bacterium]
MNKNKKIVVVNNKGGVGKTTSSNELFAPFLSFENGMKPTIVYEFDEENLHGAKYCNSDCVKFSPQKITNSNLENNIMDILLEDSYAVIDIGANKSTTYFLEALEKSALDQIISLVAIPISDGEQDTLNARNIYRKIRAMNKEVPIVFVLSRYTPSRELEYQFDYFFESLLPRIDAKDRNWVVLNDSDCIKFARKEGKTVFEMSYDNTDYKSIIKNALKKKKSSKKIKELSQRNKLLQDTVEYRKDVLIPAFNRLKELIN